MVRPDKLALVYEENSLTFKQLNTVVNRFANAMADLGVKKGDRVGILFANTYLVGIAYFAIIKLGAIVVPISFWYKEPEIEYAVNKAGISTLIVGDGFGDLISAMKEKLPTVNHYISMGVNTPEGMFAFNQLLTGRTDAEPNVDIDENDPHLMLFTSGTTGMPKGALISHRNYYLHAGNYTQAFNIREDSVVLSAYPMFHMAGIMWMSMCAYSGTTIVILGTPPTPEKILQAIERHKVTYFGVVPTLGRRILAYPDFDKYDVSSLEIAMGGSDAMPLELLEELMSKTGCSSSPQTYGLSEGGCITYLPLKDSVRKLGSSGKPICTMELKLVDEDGQEVSRGEVGEITVRGEQVMLGYWDMPEETGKALKNGWLYTGDLGRFDEEGYLYIVGRKKDMIISGGQNIYPVEIERLLLTHPKIKEAAVIGLPDKEWSETVMAVIVLEDETTMAEEEVVAYVKENMAPYNKPRHVRFVKELPKTAATGKLQKAELRNSYIQELNLR
jgi:fatty-acyl-CoA synthase